MSDRIDKLCCGCKKYFPKVSICGRCAGTTYCSKECQKAVWPLHKATCGRKLTIREIDAITRPIVHNTNLLGICSAVFARFSHGEGAAVCSVSVHLAALGIYRGTISFDPDIYEYSMMGHGCTLFVFDTPGVKPVSKPVHLAIEHCQKALADTKDTNNWIANMCINTHIKFEITNEGMARVTFSS